MVKIDICICTFRREQILDTVQSLFALDVPEQLQPSIVILDNDVTDSARVRIEKIADGSRFPVSYVHAPSRNISIARNAGLDQSDADWIAYIDDDETARPDWLSELWRTAQSDGADIVFGAVSATYQDGTPDWVAELGLHSPLPQVRNGTIETGYTGNVLMRWAGTPWADQRFELALGRKGGEDTEFFYRLGGLGATMTVAKDAIVDEELPLNRTTFRFIARRRFSAGHSYAISMLRKRQGRRAGLFGLALAKALFSFLIVPVTIFWPSRWRYWLFRGLFHTGVAASSLGITRADLYG
jgi:succinoglycan biosynthesis protein ExoM